MKNNYKLFVYGSLRKNSFNYNKYLIGKVVNSKKARVRGKLYHIENKGYPALVSGSDWVYGEYIEIDYKSDLLNKLDVLEKSLDKDIKKREYNRERFSVELIEEKINVKAYVYLYNKYCNFNQNDKLKYIKTGDWIEYFKNKF